MLGWHSHKWTKSSVHLLYSCCVKLMKLSISWFLHLFGWFLSSISSPMLLFALRQPVSCWILSVLISTQFRVCALGIPMIYQLGILYLKAILIFGFWNYWNLCKWKSILLRKIFLNIKLFFFPNIYIQHYWMLWIFYSNLKDFEIQHQFYIQKSI